MRCMLYASNRTTTTIDYDNVFCNETTVTTIPYVAFYDSTPPVDEFSAEVRKWRTHYDAVAKSREMAVRPLPAAVLRQQVLARPVHSLLFKLRCSRLRPPERYCLRKYRRKR